MVLKCFNIHLKLIPTISYGRFERILLQREESEKSNESRKMLFIL